MFADLSYAESVQMITTVFVVAACALAALVILVTLVPEHVFATSEQGSSAWAEGELAPPPEHGHFREPADLAEVDARARWFARAAVIHNPAPQRVDEFVAPAPLAFPATPYVGYTVGARVDELFSRREPIGRHRAPELVLAAA